ncbi:uncharacterized protein N7459_006149 [Penicillium hispanicum]|uniref:uncharacterized protein n=1 Tax=Penicillium hispanicum TaxID=1080232 RepID=UPI0025407A48|nr:uncharacterized protein N7459_006149 [Penicillium hispanicum]KAJ5580164.1 hypothetical protein N7459_006149 [Penicillium hispanicum]
MDIENTCVREPEAGPHSVSGHTFVLPDRTIVFPPLGRQSDSSTSAINTDSKPISVVSDQSLCLMPSPQNIMEPSTTYNLTSPPADPSSLALFLGNTSSQSAELGWNSGLGARGPGSGVWNESMGLLPAVSAGDTFYMSPENDSFRLPCASSAPFAQVPLGDPLARLEPGQVFELQPVRITQGINGQVEDPCQRPIPLGSITLDSLTANQVLFFFGVLGIMGRLNPRYQFKFGGPGGQKVGVRLTMYGHTIVVSPCADNANVARVAACHRALSKLRKFNPQWLVPPLPMDGLTRPEWNWVRLLEEFCTGEGWGMPLYSPTVAGSQQWHCDISVNSQLFRTVSPCDSLGEAQNTAAHAALYHLLVTETVPFSVILPADPSPSFAVIDNGFDAAEQQSNIQVGTSGASAGIGPKEPSPLSVIPNQGSRKKRNKQAKAQAQIQFQRQPQRQPQPKTQAQPLSQGKKAKKKNAISSSTATQCGNSNRIPLTHSRLPPLDEPMEMTEDPLLTLRAIQQKLSELDPTASYFRIMKSKHYGRCILALSVLQIFIQLKLIPLQPTDVCEVLKVNPPDVRYEKNTNDSNPSAHFVRAWFDTSDPYLSRASPVTLAHLPATDVDSAHSLGVKKVILFLLMMAKEDAGLESSDQTYATELPILRSLELEIEQRIHHD